VANTPRSVLASIVGWVLVALVVFWALGAIVGTIRFLVRFGIFLLVLAVLAVAYFRLKLPDDE
jgi:hypothetical protein